MPAPIPALAPVPSPFFLLDDPPPPPPTSSPEKELEPESPGCDGAVSPGARVNVIVEWTVVEAPTARVLVAVVVECV